MLLPVPAWGEMFRKKDLAARRTARQTEIFHSKNLR
jgi:hypothetical protein